MFSKDCYIRVAKTRDYFVKRWLFKSDCEREENKVEEVQTADYRNYLPFQICVQRAAISRSLKLGIVW